VKALLTKLPLGSLLALRGSCKTTQKWVDVDYRSVLSEHLKNIQIAWCACGHGDGDCKHKTRKEVPDLPFSNFCVYITAPEEYEKPEFIRFREGFGPSILKLSVDSFWKCNTPGEREFFESLNRLEQLKIYQIFTTGPSDSKSRIPSSIRNLNSLTIYEPEKWDDHTSVPYSFQMFANARNLKIFESPYVKTVEEIPASDAFRNNLRWFLDSWERRIKVSNGMETLTDITLLSWAKDGITTENLSDWIQFVRWLLQSSSEIRFRDVTSDMLDSLKDEPDELQKRFADRIVSIRGFKWSIRNLEMSNLEEIFLFDLPLFSDQNVDQSLIHPQWPKLKKITTGLIVNYVS
jgi:hypothetical protein